MWRSLSALLAMALASLQVSAQTPAPQRPTFEVASIKENTSLHEGGSMGTPPGRFIARNIPLAGLVGFAYGLKGYELAATIDWTSTVRYEVDAKTDGVVPPSQLRLMVQALLADRFKLSIHTETREVQGYRLVTTGKLGPGLKLSILDCSTSPLPDPCLAGHIDFGPIVTEIEEFGIPASKLAELLSGFTNAPIADESRLTGFFDVKARWSTDLSAAPEQPLIFTAVQEQLGLKLEPRRVPARVFVIDHAERPTPD